MAKLDVEEVLYIKNIHTWKNLENSVHFDTNISQNSLLIEEKKSMAESGYVRVLSITIYMA